MDKKINIPHILKGKHHKTEYYLYKQIIFILFFFFFQNCISLSQSKKTDVNIFNYYSEISLVIRGSGNQNLTSDEFIYEPSDIILNNKSIKNKCKRECELNEEENYITLIFNQSLDTFENMFKNIHNINSINLSNFDTSKIVNMSSMFYNCSNLEKITFGNINTSLVQDMSYLFYLCSGLTYIDLSNFDTSSVTNMGMMFAACESLISIDVSMFNTSNVLYMRSMFNRCKTLISIDISRFDTSKVTSMALLFYNCKNLTMVNLGNINTSCVEDMQKMFYLCGNIKSIDISKFDTSKVTNIAYMFYNCTNLESVNFGNINTSSVMDIKCLFYHCHNITSIDLSNFDTSSVIDMRNSFFHCYKLKSIIFSNKFNTSKLVSTYSMFSHCKELISLDLSSFDITKVTCMDYMFNNCYNLKFLNLSHFAPSNITSMQLTFKNCSGLIYLNLKSFETNSKTNILQTLELVPNNVKFCIENEATQNYLLQNEKFSNCSDICFNDNIKIDILNNICIESCISKGYNYEYNNICYNACPENTFTSIDNPNICYDKTPEGYYFDSQDNNFKKCFSSCKYCYGPGEENNHNCIECSLGKIFLNDSNQETNCYEKCDYYYYFDDFNNYICLEERNCPQNYSKLIKEKNKCIDDCNKDNIYIYEYNNICYKEIQVEFIETTNIENNKLFSDYGLEVLKEDLNMKNYKELITNGDVIEKIVNGESGIIKKENNITYQIIAIQEQEKYSDDNISNINIGICEDILRSEYNINKSFPLILYKVDYYPPDTLMPIVGYEIYHPISKEKLNLNLCQNVSIKINIPASIDENKLFKYEPKSKFYSDNCFSYTTEDGTDIILNDRKKEFKDKNLSLCEDKCEYIGYNEVHKQSSCECVIKNEMALVSQLMDNSNKLSNNIFENDTNSNNGVSNMKSIKCMNELFSKDGLKNNISSYLLIFFITYFLLSIVLFIKCGYPILESQIKEIINSKKDKKNNKEQTDKKNIRRKSKIKKIVNFPPKNKGKKIKNFLKVPNLNNQNKNDKSSRININLKNKDNLLKPGKSTIKRKKKKLKCKANNILKTNIPQNNNSDCDTNIKINFNDFELNTLNLADAINYDKRTFLDYYFSLI